MRRVILLFLCALFLPWNTVYAAEKPHSISAGSAIVMDANTGLVLFEKNADVKRSMASTTKIMTTLLLLEQGNLQEQITVTEDMVQVEGTSMGLLAGDVVTREGLCYGMMLSSGNDAANAAAIIHSGSLTAFADAMNQKACALGMKNTHFVTPSGLDDEQHYSTAYDMALLTVAALKNKDFRTIAAAPKATVYYGNPPYRRTLQNHNRLLTSYEGCIGVKTGFTKKSGRCLVSAATRQGATLLCVTLSAPDDWNDHISLLDYGFSLTEPITHPANTLTLPAVGGIRDTVTLSHPELSLSLPESAKKDLAFRLALPPFVYAPLAQGQTVGQLELTYKEQVIQSVPVTVDTPLEIQPYIPSFWEKFFENFCRFLC